MHPFNNLIEKLEAKALNSLSGATLSVVCGVLFLWSQYPQVAWALILIGSFVLLTALVAVIRPLLRVPPLTLPEEVIQSVQVLRLSDALASGLRTKMQILQRARCVSFATMPVVLIVVFFYSAAMIVPPLIALSLLASLLIDAAAQLWAAVGDTPAMMGLIAKKGLATALFRYAVLLVFIPVVPMLSFLVLRSVNPFGNRVAFAGRHIEHLARQAESVQRIVATIEHRDLFVLYLRSFASEAESFEQYKSEFYGWPQWLKMRQNAVDQATIDIIVARLPVFALANFNDPAPPTGLNVLYAGECHWQQAVEELADLAYAIVIYAAASTPALIWEMEMIERLGLKRQTMVLLASNAPPEFERYVLSHFLNVLRVPPHLPQPTFESIFTKMSKELPYINYFRRARAELEPAHTPEPQRFRLDDDLDGWLTALPVDKNRL